MNILFVTTQVCVICSGAKRWAFVDNYTSRKYRETIYKTVILTALLFNTCTAFPQTALSWFAPFQVGAHHIGLFWCLYDRSYTFGGSKNGILQGSGV